MRKLEETPFETSRNQIQCGIVRATEQALTFLNHERGSKWHHYPARGRRSQLFTNAARSTGIRI